MPRDGKTTRGAPSKRQTKAKPASAAQRINKAPVAESFTERTRQPAISQRHDSIRVRHREFLWDIVGSIDFAYDQFAVNPGMAETFPWLSAIANRYESYRFHKLRFVYEPATSTSTSGTVMMACDYDANDAGPNTKTVMMAYKNAQRSAPWSRCENVSDVQDMRKVPTYYVRSGAVASTDIKTYDVANFFIATNGQAAATDIGELYVEYDVELLTPQLNNSAPSLDMINSTGAGVVNNGAFGTASAATLAGGLATNIDVTHLNASDLRINQAGTYVLELLAQAATSVTWGSSLAAGAGLVKQIGSGIGSTASTLSMASYVFKADRGDIIRPILTLVGAPSLSRWRLTEAAPAA